MNKESNYTISSRALSSRRFVWICTTLLVGIFSSNASAKVSFRFQIRPILSQHCFRCHGETEEPQSEFRIDSYDGATADLGGYAAIVPGEPDASELMRRITTDDLEERMPPAENQDTLTSQEVALLRQWISDGARYEGHWAYQPIESPLVPDVPSGGQSATDIDRFVVAKLSSTGLALSPKADKPTLIRRATFDLIGLPPTWDEVTAFVNDDSSDAFANVIDRLLASTRYGERWGRHWLDIARYADTYGGGAEEAKRFPFSYTYRDYVIGAFNSDLPYDRFVLEQLAADQIGLEQNAAPLAALGFLTVGRRFANPHDLVDDRIDVVTRGLLGLTVTCARCHDHKFDAISTEDYYSLYAVLGSSEEPDELPVLGTPEDTEEVRSFQRELNARKQVHYDFTREQSEVMRSRLRMEVGKYLRELLSGTPEHDLAASFISFRTDDLRPPVLERWRKYLADAASTNDPVWEPWFRLSKLSNADFEQQSASLLAALVDENGDPTKLTSMHEFNATPPRWNPRVLDALRAKPLRAMQDVADVYGGLFAEVQEQWLQSLVSAAREALPNAEIAPDGDPRHSEIDSPVNRQIRHHLYAQGSPTAVPDKLAKGLLNRPIHDHGFGLAAKIHEWHLTSPNSPPRAMVLNESESPPTYFVFRRGNPIDRGVPVRPRFLEILSDTVPVPFADGQRRLGLARTLIDPRNPLTRRVIVNWVWRHHFGQAIVTTPDDFGEHGDPPTHPELLDYLAATFLDEGWSLKRLHRRIMPGPSHQNFTQTAVFRGTWCPMQLLFSFASNWTSKCPA